MELQLRPEDTAQTGEHNLPHLEAEGKSASLPIRTVVRSDNQSKAVWLQREAWPKASAFSLSLFRSAVGTYEVKLQDDVP
jgi:hypothetical protein